jgi:hypothetical protein
MQPPAGCGAGEAGAGRREKRGSSGEIFASRYERLAIIGFRILFGISKELPAFAKRADFAYNSYFRAAEKDEHPQAVEIPSNQRSLHGQG